MSDMQTNLPLLIVRPFILNSVINFSTHLWSVKWNALLVIPLPCAFHSISFNVNVTHASTISQMIWSTSYHHMTLLVHRSWPHLLFTVVFVHRRQVLFKLYRHVVYQAKSCLDLLHLSHMTPCHVSYAMSSFITCMSFATYSSHFTSMAWIAHTSVPVD